MTLPIEPGSNVSPTAREPFSLASSLPASIWSVSSSATISLVCRSITTAIAHEASNSSTPSISTFLTYQSTSWSMVSLTSLPSTASCESVRVPGISSPPLPRCFTS